MSLDKIEIKGFKSIKELNLELKNINILIGANGAGKSNLISFFKLLNELIEKRLQFFVATKGGANSFLYHGRKVTSSISARFHFALNEYYFSLSPTDVNSFVFETEELIFKGLYHNSRPTTYLGSGHPESLAYDAFSKNNRIAQYVIPKVATWKVYHFHDTSDSAPCKQPCDINDNMYLRGDAANLPAFLFLLKEKFPKHYSNIVETIQLVTPFFDDFILRPLTSNSSMIQLEWREKDSDFPFRASNLSDGTLRFICLATLLLQPFMPSLIILDEPELGLHPYAISILAQLLKQSSLTSQLLISTQSVTLINHFSPEDVIAVDKQQGQSVFHRLDKMKIEEWMEEYSLGELWEKNTFGGRPQNG
jgi:predicted ATPase